MCTEKKICNRSLYSFSFLGEGEVYFSSFVQWTSSYFIIKRKKKKPKVLFKKKKKTFPILLEPAHLSLSHSVATTTPGCLSALDPSQPMIIPVSPALHRDWQRLALRSTGGIGPLSEPGSTWRAGSGTFL